MGPYLLVPVFVEFVCTASRWIFVSMGLSRFYRTILEHPPPLMLCQCLDIHNTEITNGLKLSSQSVV